MFAAAPNEDFAPRMLHAVVMLTTRSVLRSPPSGRSQLGGSAPVKLTYWLFVRALLQSSRSLGLSAGTCPIPSRNLSVRGLRSSSRKKNSFLLSAPHCP